MLRLDSLSREIRRELESVYGDRLCGVYIFGSYARGQADPESDFDVLIVLDRVDSYGAEIERTSELGSRLSLEFGVSISQVFVSESEWQAAETPFLRNVRAEAVAA